MEVEIKNECRCAKNEDNDKINPKLEEIINDIAKKEGFSSYKLIVRNLPHDGNSFLGMLTEVTVRDTDNKDLNIFVKSILPSATELKMVALPHVYKTELFLYLELSPLLEKLQADAQVPVEERYKLVKCYNESNAEHIIMENMNKKGFTTSNRFDLISLEYAEVAIKATARFNALGFVLQEKEPKYYQENIMPLRYPIQYEGQFREFVERMAFNALDYLKDSAKTKLENYIPTMIKNGGIYLKDRDSTATICHGDFRPNNFLTNVVEGKITGLVPVDYQFLHHGSPLNDFIFFIFGATDRKFRQQHLDYLRNLYYDTMGQYLEYFDMKIEKYYPREEYERLFKERLDYGLFVGIWYLQMNHATGDNILDFSKSQLADADFGKNDTTKILIQQLVDEFIELGFL